MPRRLQMIDGGRLVDDAGISSPNLPVANDQVPSTKDVDAAEGSHP